MILDSPVGLHQGGQVAAPVFQRIAQQVLEYLHVPHDRGASCEPPIAAGQEQGEGSGSGRRLARPSGDAIWKWRMHERRRCPCSQLCRAPAVKPSPALRQRWFLRRCAERSRTARRSPAAAQSTAPAGESFVEQLPSNGTVVLDVEQGGIVVPSFLGKSVRGASKLAETAGWIWSCGQRHGPGTIARGGIAVVGQIVVKFGR